jgi:hypothetical protein
MQIRGGPILYHCSYFRTILIEEKALAIFLPARARVLRVTLTCTYSLPYSLVMRLRIGEQRNALAPTIYTRIA